MKCSAVTQALQGQLAIYVNIYTQEEHWRFQNKKEGKDQESIQSSTTPDPKHYKRSRAYFLSFRVIIFQPSR